MQRSWFNNRLTSAKQKSLLYKSLADLVQSMMDTFVDPWLERITNRKSIFSMSKEDLETRTNELGQFLLSGRRIHLPFRCCYNSGLMRSILRVLNAL